VAVKPIPDGYHSVTPYLMVKNAAGLLAFLEKAFGAIETEKMTGPNGAIMHAEVKIGDSRVMLAEAQGQWQPMASSIYLYVPDSDATYSQALAAGATSVMEPMDQFYGDRHGGVMDQFGNIWWIATHVEDVPRGELDRRAQEWMSKKTS
jgi:PhnB protein